MTIRIGLLVLVVLFLSGYAWRNWFKALLGGIVLFAFLENPNMPRSIAGVPGLNLWNLLFLNITFAWIGQRKLEGNEWDFPSGVRIALFLYLSVVILAFLRAFIDPSVYYLGTRQDLLLNYFVNPLKFLLPALMLYDGCRTRQRVFLAVGAILAVYFILALLAIKSMGLQFDLSSGDEMSSRAARRIAKDVGYGRVYLSMMLSGASWAIVAFALYFKQWWLRFALLGAAGITFLGQAVTGGRTGYVTWGAVGLFLCVVKWRKILPLMPLSVAILIAFVPAVRDRMLEGFAQQDNGMVSETDTSAITSGRSEIWPLVINEIKESPLIGYGRIAMQRTGLTQLCIIEYGEPFDHPHNAYFEMLLDNGFLGLACVFPIFFIGGRRSFSLFRRRDDPLLSMVGGVALSLLLALLIAAVGSQTFYPHEGLVPMWAALAVALRVFVTDQEQAYSWQSADSECEPAFEPATSTGVGTTPLERDIRPTDWLG